MADLSEVLSGSAVNDAYNIAQEADQTVNDLLAWVRNPNGQNFTINGITLTPADTQSGAGTLMVDRLMSELSNLESLAANALAMLQRSAKEINSKMS